jgi:hypothetical protein
MSPSCDDLDPFFDGELPAEAQVEFREHLGGCERCQRALRGRMLEAVVVATAKQDARKDSAVPAAIALPPRRRLVPRWMWAPAAALAAAAAVAMIWWKVGSRAPAPQPEVALALELKPQRGVDVRFSAPVLDAYRPRAVVRSTSIAREEIGQQKLAELERRNDLTALLGARALNGDIASAGAQAAKLPESAATLSDRAALALLETEEQHAAERALSLAARARRLDRSLEPAMWNEAIALERLELTLTAAEAFDEIARRGGGGWPAEAKERAAKLRNTYNRDLEQWKQLSDDADRMAGGGPPMSPDRARLAPGLARSALYVAIAAAADRARLDALVPLAGALAVTPELDRVRGSDLARRAPLARRLAEAIGAEPAQAASSEAKRAALRKLRAQAHAAGVEDLARAVTLLIPDKHFHEDGAGKDDLGELKALAAAGPWWRMVAVERQAYALMYRQQRFAEVDLVTRDTVESCRAGARDRDTYWCPQILRTLAAANAEMGRVDRAYKVAAEAQRMAHDAGNRPEEGRVFQVLGQTAPSRVVEWIEPSVVAGAYLREAASRIPHCLMRLYTLDVAGRAALDFQRYEDAERLLDEADRLDETQCHDPRYNAEEIRLRLIVHRPTAERVEQLARNVQRIETRWGKDLDPEAHLYNEYLLARARLALTGDARQVAALQAVIEQAGSFAGQRYPRTILTRGNGALAERAARRGAADEALAAIARRMGVQLEPGCAVGINHDDRITVVVRGADGHAVAEVRDVPEGQRVLTGSDLLSRPMHARLAGCPRIDVLATGPYLGVAGLLGPELRWAYRLSPRLTTEPLHLERQVVVTDVDSPADLGLPPLSRMQLGPQALVVERSRATPDGVLSAIADADLAVINAHGVTDANEPSAASLVLSPDPAGSYWLTADQVGHARLSRAPVIILAACHAGRVQVSAEPWSLASSFLHAGARAVIAPTTEIPDDTANEVFASIVKRMQAGRSPDQAVAEERHARGTPWLASVVVFQ